MIVLHVRRIGTGHLRLSLAIDHPLATAETESARCAVRNSPYHGTNEMLSSVAETALQHHSTKRRRNVGTKRK